MILVHQHLLAVSAQAPSTFLLLGPIALQMLYGNVWANGFGLGPMAGGAGGTTQVRRHAQANATPWTIHMHCAFAC
jgi:hypothetical protein